MRGQRTCSLLDASVVKECNIIVKYIPLDNMITWLEMMTGERGGGEYK